ncbi:MAG: ATP-binding protein, partial [Verrucomicrobiota bacterium]
MPLIADPDLSRALVSPALEQVCNREKLCFESVFHHAPPAMAIVDNERRIAYGNIAFCDLFGLLSAAVSGKLFSELVHPESKAKMEACFAQCFSSGQPCTSCREWAYLGNAAEALCCETSVTPKLAETGEVAYLIVLIHDVTVRQKADHLVKQAAERKDEFLAMLGHELRNPLNAIRHAVEISMEAKEDMFMLEWACGVVNRQSLQLTRMVDDLLDVARIDMQTTELHLRVLDLRLVLARAQTVVRHLLDARGLMFVSADLPPLIVSGDEARLEQVFVNLLHNAIKFTTEGGWIRVSARREGAEIIVIISDSGIGIAPEMQGEIFELFRQADVSLDRTQGGLGIGLTVVKSLVEKHWGSVEVSSPGLMKGSTVT